MENYELTARINQERAYGVLRELDLVNFWERWGCRVNVIGSLAMGLLVKHLDIDLHVYSRELTEEKSFAIVGELAKNPRIKELKCINGLFTEERCVAWHLQYEDSQKDIWQIDIIHIEEGTAYDGFFERMAERIKTRLTPEQRDAILRLKYETPADEVIHGVEYYRAVIEDGVESVEDMRRWVKANRKAEGIYWMPD